MDEKNNKIIKEEIKELESEVGRTGLKAGMKNNFVSNRELVRTGKLGSGKYKGPDKLAVKKKLTEKQKAFVDEYLSSGSAASAYRASIGVLGDMERGTRVGDSANGLRIKNLDKVREYLQEKIALQAEECLDIQMDLIRDDKMPPAVRTTNIIDRLNRMGVGKQEQSNGDFTGIGEITITIKHKSSEIDNVIEGDLVNTIETNE